MTKYSGGEGSMNQEQGPSKGISPFSLGNKGYFPETAPTRPPTLPKRTSMPKPPIEFPKPPEITPQPNRKDLYKRIARALTGVLLAAELVPGAVNQIQNEKDLSLDALGRDAAYAPNMYWNLGKSTVEDILRLFAKKEVVIPPTFDPKALQGVIGENNTVTTTAKEYEKVAPPLLENKILSIPLAVKFKDDKIRTSNIEIRKLPASPDRTDRTVIRIDGLKEGDTLLSPVDGEIETGYSPSAQNPDGSLQWTAFSIYSKDAQGNKIVLTYSTVGIKPLIKFKSSLEKGPPMQIKRGDPIAVLTTSASHQFFNGQIQIIGHAPFIQRIALATTSDGKVIVLQ